MEYLEYVSDKIHNSYFVDLFVRPSNSIAQKMYRHLGYQVYQTVEKYYSASSSSENNEDAFDMRKSMSRDMDKTLMQPTNKKIKPSELKFH